MDTINIGRANDNDLVLNDKAVSRYHARLSYHTGNWYIVDLQSTHGTFVNGLKVEGSAKIKPSDKIKLSEVKLVFSGSHILSDTGNVLLSLSKPADPDHGSPVRSPVGAKAASQKRSSLPAIIGIASIVLVVTAFFLLLSAADEPADDPISGIITHQREPVFRHGTIDYMVGDNAGEYTGELKDGLPHGQGTFTYETGSRSSSFHDLTVRSGTQRFVGQWRDGQKHGFGKLYLPDGAVLEGYWQNGRYTGPGRD